MFTNPRTHWAIYVCKCGAANVRSCLQVTGSCRDASLARWNNFEDRTYRSCGAVLELLYREDAYLSRAQYAPSDNDCTMRQEFIGANGKLSAVRSNVELQR